jgi:hypothetical protein
MEEQLENVEAPRTLRELFAPIATNTPSRIVLHATNATHFDLKPHVIQVLPSFHGLENKVPYNHVKTFLDICSTFSYQNFSNESVCLRLFLFSLHGRAKAWLHFNMPESITSWETMPNKSYKNFPMSKINEYHREISDFIQDEEEKFYEI